MNPIVQIPDPFRPWTWTVDGDSSTVVWPFALVASIQYLTGEHLSLPSHCHDHDSAAQ